MSEGAPTEWIAGCRDAHAALLADLSGLTDARARQPSALPDWSIGHLLTHIARNGDSVVRRLVGATRGEVLDQYAGGVEGRAHDIAIGADRPAAELVADVSASAAAVDEVMATLPDHLWSALSRTSRGILEPCTDVVFSRWREVVVHHGDLAFGPVPLPPALVAAWLPQELATLGDRTDPASLLNWIIGRGEAPILASW